MSTRTVVTPTGTWTAIERRCQVVRRDLNGFSRTEIEVYYDWQWTPRLILLSARVEVGR